MKLYIASLLLICMIVPITGCAHFSYDSKALLGIGIQDLESARSSGIERTFTLPYEDLFNTVKTILDQNNITIYQQNMEKKYIVAMGFEKQVTTTRVGIFFDTISNDQTKITLSSLSKTTIIKAEDIIFGALPE